MASYRISWRSSTKKDLRKIPQQQVEHIIAEVEALAQEPFPHGVQKLTGSERTYRIRVGEYRVIYEILSAEQMIEVERIRHRKDVYQK